MPGITVTPQDLEILAGTAVSDDQFASLNRAVRTLLATEYRGDLDTAEGRAQGVLNAVFTSVAVRLITNPTGARTVALGGASVTYGGTDEQITETFTLLAKERADLAALRGTRRRSFIALTDYPYRWTGVGW